MPVLPSALSICLTIERMNYSHSIWYSHQTIRMLQSVTTHLSFHSLNFQENFLMCVKHRAICRTSAVAVLAGSCAACSPLTFRSTNDGKVCVTTAQSLGPQVWQMLWPHIILRPWIIFSQQYHQFPVVEEESDPRSPSKRHSDNSRFFTSAVFVCVLDICPIALCHLLQLLLIESLLPLLFLCSSTFIQWTENTLILVCYWSDNPEVWACLTELSAVCCVRRHILTRSSLRFF